MTLAQTSSEGALTGNVAPENRGLQAGRSSPERSLATARLRRIAGRSRGLERQRHGRRSRHADLGSSRTEPGPAKPQRSAGFAIAPSLGLWVRFSDWSEGGIGRPAIPTERREENVARGPESARSNIGWGVGRSVGRSPPARRRRAAGEVDDIDESLLSEMAAAEAAWLRSKTADGGRPGTETEAGTGG